ncbi:GGDEF domain-containing protein [Ferrimonas balearica]|uniref:GGDEF domain-containing protein n=1 Tax=Ferrimonas balearica TaxID=44012 RepID=UPI001C99BD93|nr:GGDEF domain-containing protein [Ferrimonas balearica]MBY5990587.1 GGDEF domain-containing protein [Ferrimonas balearica]
MKVSRLWQGPGHSTLAAASSGEHTMARLRVVLILLITLVPSYKLLTGSDLTLALGVSYGALGVALLWRTFLKRREYVPAMAFFSVTLDISFITLGLWLDYLSRETPLALVNNKGTFCLYFLAITTTALRYDRRLSLYGGVLAIGSYLALLAVALPRYDPATTDPRWLARYGELYLPDQASRLIFLLMAAILAWVLVKRASALEQDALHDPLTGLYNRAFLSQHLELTLHRARRNQQPLSVVMLDLDNFKSVNDRFGHGVGDKALVAFGQRLQGALRGGDLLARVGGEEFCLVLSQTSMVEARQVMRKLTRAVNDAPFELGLAKPLSLTFSAGVSGLTDDHATPQQLLEEADQRLLHAKRQGRNNTQFAAMTA